MPWFLVETRYVPDRMPAVRPKHREFIGELATQGRVAVAGPLADDSGGVILIEAADLAALNDLLDTDPYHTEGAVSARTVREYRPVLGAWLPG